MNFSSIGRVVDMAMTSLKGLNKSPNIMNQRQPAYPMNNPYLMNQNNIYPPNQFNNMNPIGPYNMNQMHPYNMNPNNYQMMNPNYQMMNPNYQMPQRSNGFYIDQVKSFLFKQF